MNLQKQCILKGPLHKESYVTFTFPFYRNPQPFQPFLEIEFLHRLITILIAENTIIEVEIFDHLVMNCTSLEPIFVQKEFYTVRLCPVLLVG